MERRDSQNAVNPSGQGPGVNPTVVPGPGHDAPFRMAEPIPFPEPPVELPAEDAGEAPAAARQGGAIGLVTMVLAAFWIGAFGAFWIGFYGPDGVLTLPMRELAVIAIGMLGPVLLAMLVAAVLQRTESMRLTAERLQTMAQRLVRPEETAAREVTRVGRAVRREVDALNAGLETAAMRASLIEKAVDDRLQKLQAVLAEAERRAAAMTETLDGGRSRLAETADHLARETVTIERTLAGRTEAVAAAAAEAARLHAEAEAMLAQRAEVLEQTAAAAAAAVRDAAEVVGRQSAVLDGAAETALQRAEAIAERQERQRIALASLVENLRTEQQAIEAALASQRATLESAMAGAASAHAALEHDAAERAARTAAAADEITAKAAAMAEALDKLSSKAAKAGEAAAAATDAALAGVRRAIAGLPQDATDAAAAARHGLAAEIRSMEELLQRVAAAARASRGDGFAGAAPSARTETAPDLAYPIGPAPDLAPLPAPVPAGNAAPVAPRDAATPSPLAASPHGDAPRDSERGWRIWGWPKRRDADGKRWDMATLLAAADGAAPGLSQPGEGLAARILEDLQVMAIDLDRCLEEDPPVDLWRRYADGDKAVFLQRVGQVLSRSAVSRLTARLAEDSTLRDLSDRFMSAFETLLDSVAASDRDGLMLQTWLTSQPGRIYLLLSQASNRHA